MFKAFILLVLIDGQAAVETKPFDTLWICNKFAARMLDYHRDTGRYRLVEIVCIEEVKT